MCGDTGRRVYMYPTEYLMHGIGYTGVPEDISQVITDANGGKQFRISDHLASLRVTLDATGTSHDDFDPWGNPLPKGRVLASRRGYNDREKDRETGRLNLGVRSMGDGDHFTSIDPLWEKFPSMSPYAYANDNPLRLTDPTGMQATPRIQYIPATFEWLKDNGGGGGGGAAPLVVIGGLITYATQHPEQSVPFVVQMANDITQALTNPFGFAVSNMVDVLSTPHVVKSNPFKEPVEAPVIVVDPQGNAIPVPQDGQLSGSPDGRFIQVKDKDGKPTGTRKDGPHKPASHPDPRAQQPHAHIPGVTNPDGTPWLPVNQ